MFSASKVVISLDGKINFNIVLSTFPIYIPLINLIKYKGKNKLLK